MPLLTVHLRPPAALLLALGCSPPSGSSPPGTSGPRGAEPSPAPDAHTLDLTALPLPEPLPAQVWTRLAPVSLVDEHGSPRAVLSGHHTRLTLLHTWADRAEVRCEVCPTAQEGWVQTRVLLPAGHEPSPAERADPRLALALVAADLRRSAENGEPVAGRDLDAAERRLLVSLLDQGLAEHEGEALAPSFGEVYARGVGSVEFRLRPAGWEVTAMDLPVGD